MTENTNIRMGAGSKIYSGLTGPENLLLCLQLVDSDGKTYEVNFESPKALLNLYTALSDAQNMTLTRTMNLFNMMHDEIGCQQSHELLHRSIADLTDDAPPGEEVPTKPHLHIVQP